MQLFFMVILLKQVRTNPLVDFFEGEYFDSTELRVILTILAFFGLIFVCQLLYALYHCMRRRGLHQVDFREIGGQPNEEIGTHFVQLRE